MEKKEVRPVSKSEAQAYAFKVLEDVISCTVRRIRSLGGGSFGYVFLAEIDKAPNTVVMKACRTDGICEREARELKLLGEDSLIRVPQVFFTFLATDDVPIDFLCMDVMPGTDCFTDYRKLLCTKKEKARFADEITTALHHWHARTNEKFGLIDNAVFDDWFDYYRPFASEILDCARSLTSDGRLEKNVLRTMERAWDAFDFIFSEPVKSASLIHGDANVMNFMSDRRLRPLAIIDPLESKWADFEYELFQLRNLTGDRFGLYETYKAKYPVTEKCDLKTAFYALYHEVYAYIISGTKVRFILMPLVKRMNRALDDCGFISH